MCCIGFMSSAINGFRTVKANDDGDYACFELASLSPLYSLINDIDVNKFEYIIPETRLQGIASFNVGIFKEVGGCLRFEIYEKFNRLVDAVIFTIRSNYSYSIVTDADLERIKTDISFSNLCEEV